MNFREFLISVMRSTLGESNTYQIKYRLRFPMGAFNSDHIRLLMVDQLIKSFQVTGFAETGTFYGNTTRLMAVKYPKIPIHSVEVNEDYYNDCFRRLQVYKNLHLHLGSSEKVIEELLKTRQLGDRPLFYLDAHWYDYWPLCDEIRLIATYLHEAIIVIDDFQVPERDDYLFDVYKSDSDSHGERNCNLSLIRECLGAGYQYHALFPNYRAESEVSKLHGYIVLFQNVNSQRLKTFINTEFVRKHFNEYSLSSRTLKEFDNR